MIFSSLTFLFVFLPIVLFLNSLLRNIKFKNLFLLFNSLIFYAWGEQELVILMIVTILINAFSCQYIHNLQNIKKAKTILIISIIVNISFLIYFKYINFIIENLSFIGEYLGYKTINFDKINLPIGISFFTFQAISYLIDVYRGDSNIRRNPINVGLYIAFFPQLIAGPIIRYKEIENQLIKRKVIFENFINGIKRFIIGLGKKVLIANVIGGAAENIFAIQNNDLTFSLAWLGIIAFTFQIYYDFSGYSDMAIGLGKMFGFNFPENFNYPYIADSIVNFWRRWHITLSEWFRDYIYIPLGGNRKPFFRRNLNILIVFFLTGLWHGAEWTFIIWGIYHFIFIFFERCWFEKILEKMWKPLRQLYTFFIVVIGWVFFNSSSASQAIMYIKNLFGFSKGNSDLYFCAMYLNSKVIISLIIAIIFSIPNLTDIFKNKFYGYIVTSSSEMMKKLYGYAITFMELLSYCLILELSIIILANDTYNPFIYYRF